MHRMRFAVRFERHQDVKYLHKVLQGPALSLVSHLPSGPLNLPSDCLWLFPDHTLSCLHAFRPPASLPL